MWWLIGIAVGVFAIAITCYWLLKKKTSTDLIEIEGFPLKEEIKK
jgi:hypothetical protein